VHWLRDIDRPLYRAVPITATGTCFIAGALCEIDSDGEVLREWRLDLSCGPQVPERERRQAHRLWQQGSVHTTPDNHRLLLPQQTLDLDLAHHAVQRWYARRIDATPRPLSFQFMNPAGETTLSRTGDRPAPATADKRRL
jgi:hypothetical protein